MKAGERGGGREGMKGRGETLSGTKALSYSTKGIDNSKQFSVPYVYCIGRKTTVR